MLSQQHGCKHMYLHFLPIGDYFCPHLPFLMSSPWQKCVRGSQWVMMMVSQWEFNWSVSLPPTVACRTGRALCPCIFSFQVARSFNCMPSPLALLSCLVKKPTPPAPCGLFMLSPFSKQKACIENFFLAFRGLPPLIMSYMQLEYKMMALHEIYFWCREKSTSVFIEISTMKMSKDFCMVLMLLTSSWLIGSIAGGLDINIDI